jgi:hypothetical protein
VTPVGSSGSYILTAHLVGANGDELASDQETAKDATDLIPAIDRAARALRGRLGESLKSVHGTMQLAKATTASLPALRKYTEGANANSVEQDYPKSLAALEEAIKSTRRSPWRIARRRSFTTTREFVRDVQTRCGRERSSCAIGCRISSVRSSR